MLMFSNMHVVLYVQKAVYNNIILDHSIFNHIAFSSFSVIEIVLRGNIHNWVLVNI